jgi:hypothetical protein
MMMNELRTAASTAITIDTISIRPKLTDTLATPDIVPEDNLPAWESGGSCGIRMLSNGPANGPVG